MSIAKEALRLFREKYNDVVAEWKKGSKPAAPAPAPSAIYGVSPFTEGKRKKFVIPLDTSARGEIRSGYSQRYSSGYALIAPGQEITIISQAEIEGRIVDLSVAPSIARYFDILSLKAGRDEQINNCPVPASMFTERWRPRGYLLRTRVIPTSLSMYLTILNTGKKPHHFKACYLFEVTGYEDPHGEPPEFR